MLTESPVRVLYIMGCGRSGSTVLDTVLGNHYNIESVGELVKLPTNGWVNNEYCACGVRVNSCSFWADVLEEWKQSTGTNDLKEYIALNSTMNYLRKPLHKFTAPDRSSLEFTTFANQTVALFKAIGKISGKNIIVDSSKTPLRAFILSLIPEIELRLIHLVRDARGVAWSYKKSFTKNEREGVQRDLEPVPAWHTAINWNRINLRCEWVLNYLDPTISIRIIYEEFVKNPIRIFEKIGYLVSEDFVALSQKIESGCSMRVGHTIAGNRLRMKGNLKLKLDEEWRHKLSAMERSLVWVVAGFLYSRYKSDSEKS